MDPERTKRKPKTDVKGPSGKSKAKKKQRLRAVLLSVGSFLAILIAAAVLLYVLKVDTVAVKGNFYSSRETVLNRVLPEEDDYRLYKILWKSLFEVTDEEAFESLEIRMTGIQSCEITVRETEAICQILHRGAHLFLNGNGIVLGEGAGNADLLPTLEGFTVTRFQELEKIGLLEETELESALELLKHLQEFGLRPEKVVLTDGRYEAVFGDVTASLGEGVHLREKVSELSGQFPHFRTLKGVMHLENCDGSENQKRFYFEVRP